MPVSWAELAEVKRGDQWSMAAAIYHQRTYKGDPWESYWDVRQTITAAMRRSVGLAR
jgi:bifunctional non-homologous end joining protein LigD